MTATVRTNRNVQSRETLASQLDRLDGILDGLDSALAGDVREARGQSTTAAVPRLIEPSFSNWVSWLVLKGTAELSPVARFNRRQVAVFRLDCTHSRHNLEELEEKNETESKDTTI
jgi:hypothetical protein